MSSYINRGQYLDPKFLTDLQSRGIINTTFLHLADNRRQAVISAILDEAALKGPARMNIKEVARRAGVSIGSLYQYFNTRQGLFSFSTELITHQLLAAFKEYKPYLAGLPFSAALRAYFEGGVDLEPDFRGFFLYFARAAYQNDPFLLDNVVKPVARAMLEVTQAIIAAAQERGEVRRDIDFEATSRLINILIIAIYDSRFLPNLAIYYQVESQAVSPRQMLDSLLNFIQKAVQPGENSDRAD